MNTFTRSSSSFYKPRPHDLHEFLLATAVTEQTSHWPRGLRCGFAVSRLLGLRVRIAPWAWMSVFVSVVFCQVEVSVKGRSVAQRRPTKCGVSKYCNRQALYGKAITRTGSKLHRKYMPRTAYKF